MFKNKCKNYKKKFNNSASKYSKIIPTAKGYFIKKN